VRGPARKRAGLPRFGARYGAAAGRWSRWLVGTRHRWLENAGPAVQAATVRAFDGGQHAYIQTAATLAVKKAPTLLVKSRGSESALVDHQARLPHDIVDWLDADVLIVGVGRATQPRDDSPHANRAMTAQRDDPESARRISVLGGARAGGAAQSSRALPHRRGARRPDPRWTRRAACTRVELGAGVELPRRTRFPASAGERWGDKVPDRDCPASCPTIALTPAPALSPASQPPSRTLNNAEARGPATRRRSAGSQSSTDRRRGLRGAVQNGERRGRGGAPRPVPRAVSCPPRSSALPVAQAACWPVAGAKLGSAAGSAGCPWALGAPVGRYEVKARASSWPCSLTGPNSDMSRRHDRASPAIRPRCREGTVSAGTAGRPAIRSPPTTG
jgi:hypothetical protein